jgi:hypothetical protein
MPNMTAAPDDSDPGVMETLPETSNATRYPMNLYRTPLLSIYLYWSMVICTGSVIQQDGQYTVTTTWFGDTLVKVCQSLSEAGSVTPARHPAGTSAATDSMPNATTTWVRLHPYSIFPIIKPETGISCSLPLECG